MGEITGKKVMGECPVYDFKIICVFFNTTITRNATFLGPQQFSIIGSENRISFCRLWPNLECGPDVVQKCKDSKDHDQRS